MSALLDWLRPPAHITEFAAGWTPADQATAATAPVAVASATPAGQLSASLRDSLSSINASVGMSIPAVRRAVHVIAGTIGTFTLAAWRDGQRLEPDEEPTWLDQPDPQKTLSTTLNGTLRDAIWHDRSVWRILSRYSNDNLPRHMRRIQPERVSITPDQYDPDLLSELTIDGEPQPLSNAIVFNWAGVGGLQRWGFDILDLYRELQAAAGRYARAPHPKAILQNHGADLADGEVEQLLAAWEVARENRSVGYLNDVVEYKTYGWNASEMQLNDAREYAALEVARLFGLPAWALDANSGDSMTYSNVTDRRLDLLEALRPWMTPVEQTLGMDDRLLRPTGLVLPHGTTVTFDASAYTRDSPEARMRTWQIALASNVLTLEEVRRVEPLADLAAGMPEQSGPTAPSPTPAVPPSSAAGVGQPAPGDAP